MIDQYRTIDTHITLDYQDIFDTLIQIACTRGGNAAVILKQIQAATQVCYTTLHVMFDVIHCHIHVTHVIHDTIPIESLTSCHLTRI